MIEKNLFLAINSFHNPFLDFFNLIITYLGEGLIVLIVFLLCYLTTRKAYALLGIASIAISGIVVSILKNLIQRPRPLAVLEEVNAAFFSYRSLSFPSGHSTTVMAAATVLSFHYRKFAFIFYSVGLYVCYTRVYLGVHWVSDIVTGALIGYIISKIILRYCFPLAEKIAKSFTMKIVALIFYFLSGFYLMYLKVPNILKNSFYIMGVVVIISSFYFFIKIKESRSV